MVKQSKTLFSNVMFTYTKVTGTTANSFNSSAIVILLS